MRTQTRRYTTKAYLTFVALDAGGRPRLLPPLELATEEDHRRHREGEHRRRERLRAAGRSPS
jgi:acyl-CoA hydrolase